MAFGDTATITAQVVDQHKVALAVSETGLTGVTVYRVAPGMNITVRGAEDAANTGPGLWTGFDFEAPQGKDIYYAADITDGNTVVTVGPVLCNGWVDYGGDWIMPVGQPNLGMNILVEAGGWGRFTRDIVQDIQPVLNRAAPVVVSFNRRFPAGEVTFLTLSLEEREKLLLVLEYPVLMFVSRIGYGVSDPVFFAVGRVDEERTSPFGYEPSRRWTATVTQVDRPPAIYPYVVAGVDWDTRVNTESETWTTASSDFVDWYSFAGYPS